jgi:hypothetical protein
MDRHAPAALAMTGFDLQYPAGCLGSTSARENLARHCEEGEARRGNP